MKINFKLRLEPGLSGKYADYRHKRTNIGNWEYCDIREFIRTHQREWLLEIDTWHARLSEIAASISPFWWLIQGSRFPIGYPPTFNPLVFTIGVLEYCKALNIGEVSLLGCPQEVISYFQELEPGFRYSYGADFKPRPLYSISQLRRLRSSLRQCGMLLLRSLRNLPGETISLDEKRLIVYSDIVEGNIDKNRPDHFFGTMLDDCSSLGKKEILWLYFAESRSSDIYNGFTENLRKQGKDYVILQEMISPFEAIGIAYVCFRLLFLCRKIERLLPPMRIAGYQSYAFPTHYFHALIKNLFPIYELKVYFALKAILRKKSRIRKIYYPYEEKCLERGILQAVRESPKRTVCLGYSHSIHNHHHMYFRTRPVALSNPPRPDFFTVTGPSEKAWLVNEAGVEPDKIAVVGSSRYVDCLPPPPNWVNRKQNLRILVLVGKGYELNILANYLEEAPDVFVDSELIIRKYPFGWDEEQDEGICRIKQYVDNLRVDGRTPMESQIAWCDLVLFNCTSGGIVAMLSGRMSVFVDLHDIFYLDPTENKAKTDPVIRCFSAKELRETLQNIRRLSEGEYIAFCKKQRDFALNLYAPPNTDAISKLLLTADGYRPPTRWMRSSDGTEQQSEGLPMDKVQHS